MRRVLFVPAFHALLFSVVAAAAAQGEGGQPPVAREAVVEAEAARASKPEELQLLVRAATSASPRQAEAVRAIGRLERPSNVETLIPVLGSAVPAVRAEAAWALAQSAGADAGAAARVREALLQRLIGEDDAEVRGAIGEALGRLPLAEGAGSEQVEKALVGITLRVEITHRVDKQAAGGRIVGLTLTPTSHAQVPMPALIGALRGLESLARAKARSKAAFLPETLQRLRLLLTDDPATSEANNRNCPVRGRMPPGPGDWRCSA